MEAARELNRRLLAFEQTRLGGSFSPLVLSTGYASYDSDILLRTFRLLEQEGSITPTARFLDLGSGLGHAVATAAQQGYHAIGVERDQTLYNLSMCLLSDLTEAKLLNGPWLLQHADYFPDVYSEFRLSTGSVAARYEQNGWQPEDPPLSKNRPRIDTTVLEESDLLFAYTWGYEMPAAYELFSRYASSEAMLLNASGPWGFNRHSLLRDLGLTSETLLTEGLEVLIAGSRDKRGCFPPEGLDEVELYLVHKH